MDVGKVSRRKVQLQNLQNAQVIEKSKGMNDADKSIFDKLDLDHNGVIDAEELNALTGADKNGNDKLSRSEVKKFLKEHNLNLKNKDVIEFLNRYGIKADEIESAITSGEGADKKVTINYGDNNGTKTINADGSYETDKTDADNQEVKTSYTKEGVKTQETVVSADKKLTTLTNYEQDGTTPSQKVETTINDEGETSSVSTTTYNDGKISKNVTDDKTNQTVTTTDYVLNGAGSEIPEKKVIVSSNPENTFEQTTTFENGVQKQQVTHNTSQNYEQTINYDAEGNQISRTYSQGTATSNYETINGKEYLMHKEEKLNNDAVRKYDYKYDDNGSEETITEPDGAKTCNVSNLEGHKLSQTKIDNKGKQTAAIYDGNGNTVAFERNGQQIQIAFQNRMSVQQFCNQFGCSVADFKAANGGKTKFTPGETVVIPGEIAADNKKLQSLKTGQEARAEFEKDEQIRAEAKARREREEAILKELGMTKRATGEVKAHYRNTHNETITLKKVAEAEKGRSICVDKNGNYIVVAQDGVILKSDYVKNPEKYEQAQKYNENVKTRRNAENLAQQFYKIADDNSGTSSMKKMQELLDKNINSKNIVAFLDAYDREKTRQGDSSIIDTVTSEIGAGGTKQQRQVLMSIMNNLCAAAKEAGVSDGDIKKAKKDFESSLNKEFNAVLRRTNPKDMEKAIDFLRGAIASRANGGGQISEQDAIEQFNSAFGTENETAQKDYSQARENEGWTAKVGDTVCGWFGCNTIADMDKKLGANAAAVKKLAGSKTEAEFKKNYKEIFGIDFDKNKIAARQTAIDKYNLAQNCNSTIQMTNKALKASGSYSGLRASLKSNFKYDDALIDQIIQNYANQSGKTTLSDEDKKQLLVQFLQDTKSNASQNFIKASGGKTLEQMAKDVDLITKSAFGTNDIVKDVIQFNENQQTTEMVTEAAFEIAGTVALQFVPGLGQVAAARLAVSAARWGTKAVKVVNFATRAEKVFATVSRFQKGEAIASAATRTAKAVNRGVQIGSQMLNAGVATAGVDLSDGKSVKETTKKALMNMSFAGVGASSSILAPKLMQAFGIADKALATEIAEEIINAAGSYGVTKLEGGEYGSTDAFVDFASGLIMARISHIKMGSTHADAHVSTHTPTPTITPDAAVGLNTLDNAVKGGSSGGKFSAQKLEQAVDEITAELQQGATPQRAADLYMEGATHGAQSRAQGKEFQRTVAENSGFEIQDGKRIATTPEGQAVVDEINQRVAQRADVILHSETRGPLSPSDAVMLNDHITHNLDTPEAIMQFKEELTASYAGHHAQIQGVDQVDKVIQFADKKLNALKAQKANIDEVIGMMVPGKGMDAQALASAKGVMANPASTLEDLQSLRDAVAKTKKFDAQKKLLKDLDAKIAEMKQSPLTPQGAKVNDEADLGAQDVVSDRKVSSETEVKTEKATTQAKAEAEVEAKAEAEEGHDVQGTADKKTFISPELQQMIENIPCLQSFKNTNDKFYNETIEKIKEAVTKNANGNEEIIKRRIQTLDKDVIGDYIIHLNTKNIDIILDNIPIIKEIRSNILDHFYWNTGEVISGINKDNLQSILEASRKIQSGDTDALQYLHYINYSNHPHKVVYSGETAEVDTRQIMYLLSARDSNDDLIFDREISKVFSSQIDMTEKKAYGRSFAGILDQKPELLDIVSATQGMDSKAYTDYIENLINQGALPEKNEHKAICT